MMRVLILGGTGMLGHKLLQVFGPRFDTWATVRALPPAAVAAGIIDPRRVIAAVDAFDFGSLRRAIDKVRPAVVVNAIGVVKQSSVVNDPVATITVNSLLPHQVAAICGDAGIRVVHISTDCVFAGRKGMYTEDDPADAPDLYGRSKLLGEVTAAGALTLRTSLIGLELTTCHGLIGWFLSNRGGSVKGYTGAIFSGFPTVVLAEILADCINRHPDLSGLYHVSADPIKKYDLLCLVRDAYGVSIDIEPSADMSIDRSLDSSRFRSATGLVPPSWPELVARMAADPTDYPARRHHAL